MVLLNRLEFFTYRKVERDLTVGLINKMVSCRSPVIAVAVADGMESIVENAVF